MRMRSLRLRQAVVRLPTAVSPRLPLRVEVPNRPRDEQLSSGHPRTVVFRLREEWQPIASMVRSVRHQVRIVQLLHPRIPRPVWGGARQLK
eukprot:scaffold142013_cov31-Tisochrysis_lutea.AAC.3